MCNRRNDWVPFGPNESDWTTDDMPAKTYEQRLNRLRQAELEEKIIGFLGSKEKAQKSWKAMQDFYNQLEQVEGKPEGDLGEILDYVGSKTMAAYLERVFKLTP